MNTINNKLPELADYPIYRNTGVITTDNHENHFVSYDDASTIFTKDDRENVPSGDEDNTAEIETS